LGSQVSAPTGLGLEHFHAVAIEGRIGDERTHRRRLALVCLEIEIELARST
jgi:hypothetical protein